MKEDMKKRHSCTKTKKLLTFDDGLAERQSPVIAVASPIVAALSVLSDVGGEDESDEGCKKRSIGGCSRSTRHCQLLAEFLEAKAVC